MLKKYFLILSVFCFLLVSGNAYSQWTFAGAVTGAGASPSISVIDQNTVVVFGGPNGSPQVFLSTNGGTSFSPITGTGLGSLELYCGWASSNTTMFAGNGGAVGGAGGNATLYMTTNGGTTWTSAASTGGTAGFFNIVTFSRSNPMVGYAQSDPPTGSGQAFYVTVTTNGGANWNTVTCPGVSGVIGSQNAGFIIDSQFYGFGLNGGTPRVYMTSNGGTNWYIGNLTGLTGAFVGAIAFHDNKQTGLSMSTTSLPNIARTTNGGLNWTAVNVSNTGITSTAGNPNTIRWIDNSNTVYFNGAAGSNGVIAKSTNGGLNWSAQTTSGLTGVFHMDFVRVGTNVYGYAVAGDGSVLKITEVVTGVEDPISNVPAEYKLSQNYPNPFNPATTINFSIPQASYVTLKVYNALGKEVASIVDGQMQAGNYSQQFVAAANLGSGVYFYKLTAGNFSETKRMILTK